MPYPCFISYVHGQGELMRPFMEEFVNLLWAELETYFDDRPWWDKERLLPGVKFNSEIPQAMCASVVMIVIYVPKYERHPYCLQELLAMKALEQERIAVLGSAAPSELGMIIPVILRQGNGLPPILETSRRQYSDFSAYTTATTNIKTNPEYVTKIRNIVTAILLVESKMKAVGAAAWGDCKGFSLPEAGKLPPVRPGDGTAESPLPTR